MRSERAKTQISHTQFAHPDEQEPQTATEGNEIVNPELPHPDEEERGPNPKAAMASGTTGKEAHPDEEERGKM